MRNRVCLLIALMCGVIFVSTAPAQEGHPLTGTWVGDWGAPSSTQRTHLTFVLNWDGDKVSGILNPGPDAVPLGNVVLDPANWTVRIEADTKDRSGSPVHVSAEGTIQNLGLPNRSITGTWKQGAVSGDFKITRN